jgi:peptide/nickel transport system substrate-binding protein
VLGTFDSINPFIVKGLALSQIAATSSKACLARHYDEPFTLYGLLAPHGRDRRRAHLRYLRARSRGEVL